LYTSITGFWSFALIGWQLLIIIGGRVIGVMFTFYAFRLCFRKKTINFRQLVFITYGGMIRGAIAFALVIRIPYTCPGEEECLEMKYYELQKSTCLIVVMVTTLFFGTFMKQAMAVLLGDPDKLVEAPTETEATSPIKSKKSLDIEMVDLSNHPESDHHKSVDNRSERRQVEQKIGKMKRMASGKSTKSHKVQDKLART
jgi:NhaP-type Na+/H+ or K+/H+ antiporter